MPEYLYVLRPTRLEMLSEGATREEQRIVGEHSAYLNRLAQAGQVILYGRTQNMDASSFGLVVYTADTDDAARQIMESDPAVIQGVMSAQWFPYRVAYLAGREEDEG